jgi:putative transposase
MSEHGTRQRYQPEQVVNLLRQIEVAVANGKTTAQACKEVEVRGAGVLPLG